MKHYYVYKILHKETQAFYFGQRGCSNDILPENDIGKKYFTSGILREDFKSDPDKYTVTILEVFDKRNLAVETESVLISMNLSNPLCKNLTYDKAAYKRAIRKPLDDKSKKTKNIPGKTRRQMQKINAKVKSNEIAKKSLESYFDEALGCTVYVYPTAGKKFGKK